MKKYNQVVLVIFLLAACALWASNSLAASSSRPVPDVSGFTIEEAHAKYGIDSGYKYPLIFEVNAKVGQQKCVSIGPDCSFACPTAKIYNQSRHYYLNGDGSRTVRVDVYYDVNESITSRKPSC